MAQGGRGWLADGVPYLARLDEADRAKLMGLGVPMRYPARTEVIRQGEPSSHVLVITQGWLKVSAGARSGYEALLGLRGPGDIVGEMSALEGGPRSATVSTLERVSAVAVRAEEFLAFLDGAPRASRQLLLLVGGRLRAADRRRLQYAAHTVGERLADLLLELARYHGERTDEGIVIRVPLTQQELAGSVGASREAVTRLLAEPRKRGILITGRKTLCLVRPKELGEAIGSG
ncbi:MULTISPECIES: Crp/Fnr family transcriptional regulator [unclassified Streptomyces]|uniref:Crp/Fnr family transcriptional regulator n=1 Tax=unclassified Streptomyces TaxID=2593676 RepID=UPI0003741404|nr:MULTISPECIES: Crp/Fnr family transcriptional regulator [unclassified Streptomyces]MYT27913.1 cyclic nucleotide-binding domain-containing protein [Streptomyces sp. SID8354]